MDTYYELVHVALGCLAGEGLHDASGAILSAQRGASTSGEAIATIGVELRKAAKLNLGVDARAAVEAALIEGQRLWESARR